jgi:RNA polymerase sigma factor (TIGR02999 family)
MPDSPVTALLASWRQGNKAALDQLVPVVYDELRRVARARLKDERAGHALQTTALVHEAYMRLVDLNRMSFQNRAHFFAVAARLMRQILVDHARRLRADKRGGAIGIISLEDAAPPLSDNRHVDVLALDEALEQLTTYDERLCKVVELRFFAGMNIDETAEALQISTATVERDWAFAKAWLHQKLSPAADS